MAKVTVEVPEEIAKLFRALEAKLKGLEADKTGGALPVAEADVNEVTSGIALELKRRGAANEPSS